MHADSWGVPLPGVTIKIVNPLNAAVIPRGESGEICVKGPTLMLGYIGAPLDQTLDAEGFFPTGDGGYLDESGRLYWEGADLATSSRRVVRMSHHSKSTKRWRSIPA